MNKTYKVRNTFFYPALKQLTSLRFRWILRQLFKFILLKFINRLLPAPRNAGPVMGIFICTYSCNCDCPMCGLQTRAPDNTAMGLEEAKRVIDSLISINSSGICISGGEPLCYPHIFELLNYSASKEIPVTLNTNGCFRGNKAEDIVKILSCIPLTNINISIDSVNATRFDKLRGTIDGLEIVLDFAKKMIEARNRNRSLTKITAMCVVSRDNVDEIPAIVKKTRETGFDSLGFMPLHRRTETGGEQRLLCDDEICLRRFSEVLADIDDRSFIDNSADYLRIFPAAFAGKPFPYPCTAGFTTVFVDCSSNVYYCGPEVELDKKIANFNKDNATLKQIWNSPLYAEKRSQMSSCRNCYWNCHAELNVLFK
jgi:MoaA/NifB/PqqE/SkfB family radical SAM enzyme